MSNIIKRTQFFRTIFSNQTLTLNEKRILIQLNSRKPVTQKWLLNMYPAYTTAALSRTISSLVKKDLIKCIDENARQKEYTIIDSLYCDYPTSITNTLHLVAGSPLIRSVPTFDTFIAAAYLSYSPQKYSASDLLQLLPHYNETLITNSCALLICFGMMEATMIPTTSFAFLSVNNNWNGINHTPLF